MRRLTATAVALGVLGLVPGVAHADSTIYVGSAADGCPNAQFSDLVTAVRYAQSHDTIRICAGTYTVGPAAGSTPTTTTQGLVITKALTIIGVGASKVTIEPAADLVSATATGDNVRDQYGNVVTVQPPPNGPTDTSDSDINVAISGVTISNGGHLVDAGMAFYNAAGTLSGSVVTPDVGTPAGPAGVPNVGWGVVATDAYAVTPQASFFRDVTVTGDQITNYGGGGVLIDGSEASKPIYFRSGVTTIGTVTNNVITGAGDATLAQQYGIQVNAGARAVITGNVVTNNLASGPASATHPGTGVGVLLTDADLSASTGQAPTTTTSVTGNDLTGNGYGIFNGTADFPGAPASDTNSTYPIDVNGTGTTPADLPVSLTNTAQSGGTSGTVTQNYQVAGSTLAASTKSNYFGPGKGVVGGPSTATNDGISESTSGGADSVKLAATTVATAYAAPAAPSTVPDTAPVATWATPDGVNQTTLVAGTSDELLVQASDDFGVTSVDISANGTDLGTTTAPPYEESWTPTSDLVGQTVPLIATVTDESGQVTTSTINVQVVAPPPPAVTTTTTTTTTTATTPPPSSGSDPGTGSAPTPVATTPVTTTPAATVTPATAPTVNLASSFGTAAHALTALSIKPTFSAGTTKVVYKLDGKTICTATKAPFSCSAKLTGADPGARKLTITATGADGKSTTLTRTIHVAPLKAKQLTVYSKRSHGKIVVSGRLVLPSGVTAKQAGGHGSLRITYGKHSVLTKLTSGCIYTATIPNVKVGTKLTVQFGGNTVILRIAGSAKALKG